MYGHKTIRQPIICYRVVCKKYDHASLNVYLA